MNVLIFGAGYSARAFARECEPGTILFGTTRSPAKFDALRDAGISPLVFDGAATPELLRGLANTTHLVISIAPDDAGDPVLNAFTDTIRLMPKLRWIGYLSTVGVYGDYQGEWVNESDECRPVSRRSKLRVEAEQAWQTIAAEFGKPLAILRLSGIYGPGRNAFVNLENGTAKRLIKPGQVFNRIHAADIGGALWHLMGRNLGGVFNVTDDEPAPPQDVVSYAAELMGAAVPPEIPFETAQLSPMARSFYGENKRVSNARLKETGYVFCYPTYRAALSALWQDNNWRGEGGQDARSPIKPD
ncbi:MAG: SDR family oxidoreductase [Rhizobiaceae bacterium]